MYTKSFVATKGCFKVNHWSFMWKQRRMVSFSVALYNIWIRELLGNVSKKLRSYWYDKQHSKNLWKRFYVHTISFRFLYQTQSNHDLLSRGYSNLRVHHILLVMSHAVFEAPTRWLLEECCCVRRYATSFSPLIHKQGTTYNLSDSKCQLECMLEPLLYE